MVHWSGCTKHLSVGSSGQLTQHVLHWMSELHCSRHFFSTSTHVRGTLSIEVLALSKSTLSGSAARTAIVRRLAKSRHGSSSIVHGTFGHRPSSEGVLHEEFRGVNFGKAVPGLLEEAARHASGCRRTRRGLPELCVLNGTAVGGLDWELTVRKAAIRHQLTLINGVR